jgi:dTDP-4-dehydrorhamnose 3,5-epimerase
MNFLDTPIRGAKVITPDPRADARGRFMRAWCAKEFSDHGVGFLPVQANMGFSHRKGTTRGMHFQKDPAPEKKLVRCTRGAIFDVVLDLRPGPSQYSWHGVELSAENGHMLLVPEYCAHGYQTLVDDTEIYYMTSSCFAPEAASGVRFDDPLFAIRWPLPPTMVSDQDRGWPMMNGGN